MMKIPILYPCIIALFLFVTAARAGSLNFEVEGGAAWFSKNDTRIDGDTGTKFDMLDLTGDGPDSYLRYYATYEFNDRHAVRLTLAPLETEGTGQFDRDVMFVDTVFPANINTRGTYKFNTYRLTYRWTFHDSKQWEWGVGGVALVRDAKISLAQSDRRDSSDDLGVVPLLHLYGAYRLRDDVSIILDVEGAWAPQGRAVDAALKARYDFDSGWNISAGYRTLEGGADNDDVYTFAWIHYALLSAGYSF